MLSNRSCLRESGENQQVLAVYKTLRGVLSHIVLSPRTHFKHVIFVRKK